MPVTPRLRLVSIRPANPIFAGDAEEAARRMHEEIIDGRRQRRFRLRQWVPWAVAAILVVALVYLALDGILEILSRVLRRA